MRRSLITIILFSFCAAAAFAQSSTSFANISVSTKLNDIINKNSAVLSASTFEGLPLLKVEGRSKRLGRFRLEASRYVPAIGDVYINTSKVAADSVYQPILLQGVLERRLGSQSIRNPIGIAIDNRSSPTLIRISLLGRARSVRQHARIYDLRLALSSSQKSATIRSSSKPLFPAPHACGSKPASDLIDKLLTDLDSSGKLGDTDVHILDGTYREIELSVIADPEWFNEYSNNWLAQMQTHVNAVDALYRPQLGVTLRIVRQELCQAPTCPLTQTAGDPLLVQLSNYVQTNGLATYDLHHLFTAKLITDGWVGYATIGGVCLGTSAVAWTRKYWGANDLLTVAHEIGHNLGANHDAATGFVMSASGDGTARNFSDPSKAAIASALGMPWLTGCLAQISDPTATPAPTITSTVTPTPSATSTAAVTPTAPQGTPIQTPTLVPTAVPTTIATPPTSIHVTIKKKAARKRVVTFVLENPQMSLDSYSVQFLIRKHIVLTKTFPANGTLRIVVKIVAELRAKVVSTNTVLWSRSIR